MIDMLYELAHILQSKFPFIWNGIECMNSSLFYIKHRKKLRLIPDILEKYSKEYNVRAADISDLDKLVRFFAEQPNEAYEYFKPHSFEAKTVKRLIRRKSYLFFIVENSGCIVGYFFLRCYYPSKCFRGKIVDYRWRNKGIAKLMGEVSMEIASTLGLKMYGTISSENIASLASASAVNEIRIIENLPNGYMYIEYLPKRR